jgi:hypothetical protein
MQFIKLIIYYNIKKTPHSQKFGKLIHPSLHFLNFQFQFGGDLIGTKVGDEEMEK